MTKEDLFELFHGVVPITIQRMFGGMGIRSEGVFFGIVFDGELFLKVDEQSRDFFVQHGSTPFVYEKKAGEQMVMSYYRLPLDAYDERNLFGESVALALGAARRADMLKKPKASKKLQAVKKSKDALFQS